MTLRASVNSVLSTVVEGADELVAHFAVGFKKR